MGGQDEAAEQVGAAWTEQKFVVEREDQVGRAELPAGREGARRRGIFRIAFGGAAIGPSGQDVELLQRKAAFVVEDRAIDWLPRRHQLLLRVALHVLRPVDGLLVIHERERADFARSVALLAMVLQNGRDIAMISCLTGTGDRLVLAGDRTADGLRGGL